MTGFGRGTERDDRIGWTVEIGAVNRKQLDVAVSLPRGCAQLEKQLRELVALHVRRGRIDIRGTLEVFDASLSPQVARVNTSLAESYLDAWKTLSTLTDSTPPTVADLVRLPGVVEVRENETDLSLVWPPLEKAATAALDSLGEMRSSEGERLKKVLCDCAERLAVLVEKIEKQAPGVASRHRDALLQRLREAEIDADPNEDRLVREIALFADRCDIREETDRLKSHLVQLDGFLSQTDPVGRQLDFLAQEFNRECNTIASKANDAVLAHLVVEAKTEIERLREQVQNIE